MLELLLITLVDDVPEPTEVKAGPLGFAVWIFLILAVVAIGWSLSRQLRKAQAAKDAGVYGDEPVSRTEPNREPGAPDAGSSDGSSQER